MGKKVGVLLLILAVRMLVGGVVSGKCESGQQVRLEGEVEQVVQKGSNTLIKLGAFWMEFGEYKKVEKGDEVRVTGSCRRGVIDFLLGRIWLEKPRIEEIRKGEKEAGGGGKYLLLLKSKILAIYKQQLPVKEAGLVAGIVWGEKKLLDRQFYERLKETGTVHIVVASGYNVMILSVIVLKFLTYFVRRKRAVVGAIMLSFLYAVMAGWQPPVVRAWIMGAGLVVGEAVGRLVKGWWWWFLAGWAMLMIEPGLLTSVSFQLSMAAVGGLLMIEPVLAGKAERRLKERGWGRLVLKSELIPTVSAQLAVAPLLWWYFGQVQWRGVLYNLLILPLVPALMGLGAVQGLLGLLWRPLGMAAAWLVYGLAHGVVLLVG